MPGIDRHSMITHYRNPGNVSIVSDHAGRRIAWVVTVMLAINLMLPISQYIYASETGQAFWRMFPGRCWAQENRSD